MTVANSFALQPVAWVRNTRTSPVDDGWDAIASTIELAGDMPAEVLDGIEGFSHLEIIYLFDRVLTDDIVLAGHPRGDQALPRMGIFAQRKKDRPNRLGLATVELIEHRERSLLVRGLDAIDGTPVLDIKPVFREFQPRTPVRQPEWVSLLMRQYWVEDERREP